MQVEANAAQVVCGYCGTQVHLPSSPPVPKPAPAPNPVRVASHSTTSSQGRRSVTTAIVGALLPVMVIGGVVGFLA